ncbi:MAG TPA: glycosyltransferase [Candidatus Nanoarchaeia archaeon]|nr:glycosyltransferase [Candidatus Nanoarchaeia archaeon]
MKILLINNYHYSRDGVTRAYFDLAEILTAHGHEVAFFSSHGEKESPTKWSKFFVSATDFEGKKISFARKMKLIAKGFYNFEAKRNLEKLLKEFQPDVAHLHNIYHHLSPSIIGVLRKNHIPTAMTLHDYALVSPNYNLFARGKIWEGALGGKFWRCFTDRCIKDSFWRSLLATIESYFYQWRGSYRKIDLFISPSLFLIKKFKEYGFKREIIYLPNPFLPPKEAAGPAAEEKNKYFLYYGRLSQEKGIADLLRAYGRLRTEVKLKIAGAGPQEDELKKIVAGEKISGVEFIGYRTGAELWRFVAGAEAVVVPSLWYENAPYSVIEPMGLGKIVLASRLGGLTELIRDGENGFLFAAGDIADLSEKLKYILSHPELKSSIGASAIASVREKNDPEKFYQALSRLYQRLQPR